MTALGSRTSFERGVLAAAVADDDAADDDPVRSALLSVALSIILLPLPPPPPFDDGENDAGPGPGFGMRAYGLMGTGLLLKLLLGLTFDRTGVGAAEGAPDDDLGLAISTVSPRSATDPCRPADDVILLSVGPPLVPVANSSCRVLGLTSASDSDASNMASWYSFLTPSSSSPLLGLLGLPPLKSAAASFFLMRWIIWGCRPLPPLLPPRLGRLLSSSLSSSLPPAAEAAAVAVAVAVADTAMSVCFLFPSDFLFEDGKAGGGPNPTSSSSPPPMPRHPPPTPTTPTTTSPSLTMSMSSFCGL